MTPNLPENNGKPPANDSLRQHLPGRRSLLAGGALAGFLATPSPVVAATNGEKLASVESPEHSQTRGSADPEARTSSPIGSFLQTETFINAADFGVLEPWISADECTRRLQQAIDVASMTPRRPGLGYDAGALAIPPGRYEISRPLRISAPIRIFSGGATTSRFRMPSISNDLRGWFAVELRCASGFEGTTLIHSNSHGVSLQGLTLEGRGNALTGLQIDNGFEFRCENVRIFNFRGVGLDINLIQNGHLQHVMVDECGRPTDEGEALPAVRIKSSGAQESVTNTVDFYSLTVERSRHTSVAIGTGGSRISNHYAEYVRFVAPHIESTRTSNSDQVGYIPEATVPIVHIGNVEMVQFTDPFIYGGPGPLIQQEQGTHASDFSRGVNILGGTLRGQYPGLTTSLSGGPADSKTLVRLVRGDDFRIVGTRLNQYSDGPAVRIGEEFGRIVQVDATTSFEPDTPLLGDARPARRSPSRHIVHGQGEIQNDLLVQGDLRTNSRILSSPSSPTTTIKIVPFRDSPDPLPGDSWGNPAALEENVMANQIRGKIFFGSGPNPQAGAQLDVVFQNPFPTVPVVVVTPADFRSAQLGLYVNVGRDRLRLLTSKAPLPSIPVNGQAYAFNYVALG